MTDDKTHAKLQRQQATQTEACNVSIYGITSPKNCTTQTRLYAEIQ